MQVEKLINWRQVSKVLSRSKSETAIRSAQCPKIYYEPVDALLLALQTWYKEHVDKKPPQRKYTAEEIKQNLNKIEW